MENSSKKKVFIEGFWLPITSTCSGALNFTRYGLPLKLHTFAALFLSITFSISVTDTSWDCLFCQLLATQPAHNWPQHQPAASATAAAPEKSCFSSCNSQVGIPTPPYPPPLTSLSTREVTYFFSFYSQVGIPTPPYPPPLTRLQRQRSHVFSPFILR